ncbi:hypothetical protein Cgig2_020302 [Carnegiea gigantea]|uniref:Uncharacterized protein n=1 Tax=Carnegiea gigantea TaxID=171969 RepID=A0A9Q1QE37_9CARY|nr:hypothetical protein Cgig2_020302 [Carnegiea gigantea]
MPLQSTPDEHVQVTSYPSRPHTRSSLNKPDCTPLQSIPNPSKPDSNSKCLSRILTKPNYNLGEPTAAPAKCHTGSQSRNVSIHTGPNITLGTKLTPRTSTPKKQAVAVPQMPTTIKSFTFGGPWGWDDDKEAGREAEISIVGAHTEGGRVIVTCVNDNLASDDDIQDEDFIRDGEEIEDVNESEDVSLNEENNSSDSGDDDQLEIEVDQRMQLGAEIINGDGDRDLVVNKMARTLKQGTTWTRNKDGKVSLLPGHTFTCKEDLLTIMREFYIQEGLTLQKYGIHISERTCWKARKMRKDAVEGQHEEGYKYLAHYKEEFKAKNLGSGITKA